MYKYLKKIINTWLFFAFIFCPVFALHLRECQLISILNSLKQALFSSCKANFVSCDFWGEIWLIDRFGETHSVTVLHNEWYFTSSCLLFEGTSSREAISSKALWKWTLSSSSQWSDASRFFLFLFLFRSYHSSFFFLSEGCLRLQMMRNDWETEICSCLYFDGLNC